MKTAIVKTEIWKDKKLRGLNIDTKLVYLCLITNPDRNTTRFFKLDEDYLCLQSGIDHRQLKLVKKQLEEAELVYFKDDWVILGDTSYVGPAKGRLTLTIYNQDIESIPDEVLNYKDKKYLNGSGAVPEYMYIDKNIDINKDMDKDKKPQETFDDFWKLFPSRRKGDKARCKSKWVKLDSVTQALILIDLPKRVLGYDWIKNSGQYIPAPMSYLNGEKWLADIVPVPGKVSPTKLITGDPELDSY